MKSVLIIEPDQWLSDMYRTKLEKKYSVHSSTDAQSAIDVLDNHEIDLIVTDIQLGKHNGVEVVHEVRSYDDWLSIPIIILSSAPIEKIPLTPMQQKTYNIQDLMYKHDITPTDLISRINFALA